MTPISENLPDKVTFYVKVIGKSIAKKIETPYVDENIISIFTSFQEKYSTIDKINRLKHKIEKILRKKNQCVTINKIWHEVMNCNLKT